MISLISLDLIDPNPYQPRTDLDSLESMNKLESLARGIRLKRATTLPDTYGLMQVPIGRQVNDRFQLAFGHRRYEAFKINHAENGDAWAKMPLQVVELSDEEMYDFAARENGDREDINPIEKAKSILRGQETFDWTLQQAASAHGLSKSAASNLTRLLQLPEAVQAWVSAGNVGQRHARELLRLVQCDGYDKTLERKCSELARQCIGGNLSVREVEHTVNGIIKNHLDRRRLTEWIRDKSCPNCNTSLELHGQQTSFCCPKCQKIWVDTFEFTFDCRNKDKEEAERTEKEKRLHTLHTRYCPKCNHPQELNGQQIYEGTQVKCDACGTGAACSWWLQEPKIVTYRPLVLDNNAPEVIIKPNVKAACPFWTKIEDTAEICYICGKEGAEWHNNGHLHVPGADFHLCDDCYYNNLSNVRNHNQEDQLRAVLDLTKTRYKKPKEEKPRDPTADAKKAVFPENTSTEDNEPEEINPALERQRLQIDTKDRFLALVRQATIEQLREINKYLDNIAQSVFPENEVSS